MAALEPWDFQNNLAGNLKGGQPDDPAQFVDFVEDITIKGDVVAQEQALKAVQHSDGQEEKEEEQGDFRAALKEQAFALDIRLRELRPRPPIAVTWEHKPL